MYRPGRLCSERPAETQGVEGSQAWDEAVCERTLPLALLRSADFISWTDVAREAATGKAYLHSHMDVSGRPVIVVRAAKHLTGGWLARSHQWLAPGAESLPVWLPR